MAYMVCAMQHEGTERERGKKGEKKEGRKEGKSEGKAWKVSGPIGHSERGRELFTFRRRVHSKLVCAAAALGLLLAALERLWFSKRGGVAMHHAL